MNIKEINELLTQIAAKNIDDLNTLERQCRDRLDIHEVHVYDLKAALLDAYFAGKKDAQKSEK